jgi:hypothetical protein
MFCAVVQAHVTLTVWILPRRVCVPLPVQVRMASRLRVQRMNEGRNEADDLDLTVGACASPHFLLGATATKLGCPRGGYSLRVAQKSRS